ncbi:MAG: GNAT family N-acetyltransferase [Clostridia bacterium]|nr:GNAT family N-acetyltransferase [Clostridia bacterium]
MAQLKMYRFANTPYKEAPLPEGYTISAYETEADKMAWVECCKKGLVADDADESVFDGCIKDHDDTVLERDCLFLNHNGERVGTLTATFHPETQTGDFHMVGIRADYRGKGLGKYLNAYAAKKMDDAGAKWSVLTTDEWRVAAVKSYISAGFRPVFYDENMPERWEIMLDVLNIDELEMYNEDGSFNRMLHPVKKIKIGVLGARRGKSMINYCKDADNAILVAVCDNYKPVLEEVKADLNDDSITYYDDFETFLNHDMDAVVLANFANEHAPFAIRCMEKGLHVISEVLPVQTMKEAVELIEAVEKTGKLYAYAENYCYMPAPRKMRQLFKDGVLGEFEYGEGEYVHNCEPGWPGYSNCDPNHWRNTMSAFYYCTHSLGPLIHISGLRPVKVTGFELPFNARMERMGAKAGSMGVEMVTLENGAIVKSIHGVGPSKNSIWYSVYGSKGRMESAREDAENGGTQTLYVNCDKEEGDNDSAPVNTPTADRNASRANNAGHGGSDYYTMFNFCEKLRKSPFADVIDVYEAMDMFLPGMFAYRSVLNGGIPMDIPNLRNANEREKWRNDTACTDPKVAGDMLQPSYSKGNPEIGPEVYEALKEKLNK